MTCFYVFAEDVETKKPRVFRNEDTGWGFPFYFKFNSADLQAVAQSIAASAAPRSLLITAGASNFFSCAQCDEHQTRRG